MFPLKLVKFKEQQVEQVKACQSQIRNLVNSNSEFNSVERCASEVEGNGHVAFIL